MIEIYVRWCDYDLWRKACDAASRVEAARGARARMEAEHATAAAKAGDPTQGDAA